MFLSWGPLLHLQRSCLGSAPHRASSADHTGKGYLPLRALGLHQAHRVVQHVLPSQGPSTHLLSPFAMEGHVCPGPGTWMGISLASMIPLTTVGKHTKSNTLAKASMSQRLEDVACWAQLLP